MLSLPPSSRASSLPQEKRGPHQEPDRLSGRLGVDVDLGCPVNHDGRTQAPSGGAEALWSLSPGPASGFSKVTRRQGATLSGRYRSNGYTHQKNDASRNERPGSREGFYRTCWFYPNTSSLDPTLATPTAQRIDRQNQQQHRQDHRAALGFLEQAEADVEHLPQSPAPTKPSTLAMRILFSQRYRT